MKNRNLDALVRRARGDVAPEELESLRRALEPSLGPLPQPLAPHALASTAGLSLLHVAAGVALAAVIAAVVWVALVRTGSEPPTPERSRDTHEVPTTARERLAAPAVRQQAATGGASVEAPVVAVEPSHAAPRSPAPVDPGAEFALLQRAREALATDPAAALRVTDEHRRTFPRGRLSEEREVLAIEALAALGRWPAARARAERFERRYPGSVHHDRLAALLATAPS